MHGKASMVEGGSVENFPSPIIQMTSPARPAVGGIPIVDRVEQQQPFLFVDVPIPAWRRLD